MSQMFSTMDYHTLSKIVFSPDYAGFKPNVVEAPNGDGNYDEGKIYAHINEQYIQQSSLLMSQKNGLVWALNNAHRAACEFAVRIGIPSQYWPSEAHSTLRVLEYPPNVGSNSHTDMSLFTMPCYRNTTDFVTSTTRDGVYYGELAKEAIDFVPTEHLVAPSCSSSQFSIVYFAIPDHEAVLPSGIKVGGWLAERISRSRKTVEG